MSCGITHWDAFRMGQLGIMVCLFCVLVRGAVGYLESGVMPTFSLCSDGARAE